ncbi:flagellin FliC, partial [Escherichia coli]|nr:flagellin FliC [Escherichia coli]
DAATAVNVLAAVKDGSTINYTGTGNGLGIAATSAYTYHDSTKSYTFDSTGAAVAGAASSLQGTFGTDTNTAKITIDGSAQEVNIAKDGKITDTDGKALYIDSTGNLTKNGSDTLTQATLNDVLTGANSVDDTRIDFDSGMSVTLDKVNSTVDITGASISAAAMTNELTGKAYT